MDRIHLDGRYFLLRILGQGSEGVVYLAVQESTNRFLAVKEIEKAGDCYNREGIEVWKRLKHPNLPEILDFIEDEEKVWIVMEYIEGTELPKWIQTHGYPQVSVLFHWLFSICDTLAYLHGQEPPVIFGDLKPENIMIQKGKPMLVDLGSAYIRGSKTKKTGTYRIGMDETLSEMQRDLICLGKTLEETFPLRPAIFHTFAERAMGAEKDSFQTIKECIDFLKHIRRMELFRLILLLLSLLLLIVCPICIQKNKTEAQAEQIGQILEEYLDTCMEDGRFSEEEYSEFLDRWGKVDERGRTSGEKVQDNLTEYGKLCYKAGLLCWYCGEEWGGDHAAVRWFQEITMLPDELKRNSENYLNLSRWKKQMGLYEKAHDTEGFFRNYYQELKEMERSGQEDAYFQLALLKEELLFFIHYIAELKEEGIQQQEAEQLCTETKTFLKDTNEQRSNFLEMKAQIEILLPTLEESIVHIYGEEAVWEKEKRANRKDGK